MSVFGTESTEAIPQPVQQENTQRFVVLDGLRGAAAFAVITVHAHSPSWRAIFSNAPLAVDFFFLLSGFVIAHAYGERLRRGFGAFELMRLRWVRFWPMLLAAYALALTYTVIGGLIRGSFYAPFDHYLASLIFGLAFLPVPPALSVDSQTGFPLVGPSYTMFLELSANLVFALVVARLTRVWHAAIVLVFGAFLILTTIRYGTVVQGWPWHGFPGALARVGFSFFAGALVYDLWQRWRPPSFPVWASFTLLLAVFVLPVRGIWYELLSVFAIFPALVMFSAGSRASGHFKWLCLTMGTYSYGIYIIHQPIVHYVEGALPYFGTSPEGFDVWSVLLIAAIAIALTVVLTRFYEQPFRRVLERFVGARAATAP